MKIVNHQIYFFVKILGKADIKQLIHLLLFSGCLFYVTPALAEAKSRGWEFNSNDDGATATNCQNCDENIGMLVSCLRGQSLREIHLMVLEQRDDTLADKPALVKAKFEDATASMAATYSSPGEAGPYPILKLERDDKLFAMLLHAKSVVFSSNGIAATIDMTGSRKALTALDDACK